jgi:hypothetical protein
MHEKINTGGAAFPVMDQVAPNGEHIQWGELGMTLRDYFAAKAMVGLIAEPQWREGGYSLAYVIGPQTGDDAANFAAAAYKLADAMLKAREQ